MKKKIFEENIEKTVFIPVAQYRAISLKALLAGDFYGVGCVILKLRCSAQLTPILCVYLRWLCVILAINRNHSIRQYFKVFIRGLKFIRNMPYNIFLTQIQFCIPEIFKTHVKTRFLSTKSPFEFVFQCYKLTKVIL